jgi:hypothetical protein
VNSVGESRGSEILQVTPADISEPPASLIAVSSDGAGYLEWSPPIDDGGDPVAGYRVRIWHEAMIVGEFDTSGTSASFSGLTNGFEYRATVTARNSVGESVASEPAFISPFSPPVVEPPVVEPPVVDPPIVEPPIIEPPVVEPPTTFRRPGSPVDISIISATRKLITVGWTIRDSGGAPVLDYIVYTSPYKNRGFTTIPDATSAIPRIEMRKPRRGALYVRVIAVTSVGESNPSPAKRVVR